MSPSFPSLGKYQVQQEVGRGGMGAVYQCYDPLLDRVVAIKVLAPHLVWEKDFLERFLREARAAARLQHPNIIAVYDVGQDGNNYYFVMAYLPGPSLKQLITQRGRFAAVDAVRVLRQLADALDYAHGRGLIHRDVKPANVMFDERGQAVLTDFGIAKAAEESRLTATGSSIGTPHYMAPEQITGSPVDARTDQYSLGIVAFELLTGRVPFDADTTTAILFKHVNNPPPSILALCPDLPSAVDGVLNRALSKSPAERYGSCGMLVNALEQATTHPVMPPQTIARPAPPPVVRPVITGPPAPSQSRPHSTPVPLTPPVPAQPAPPGAQPAENNGRSILAIIALVMGVLSLCGSIYVFCSFPMAITSIILGGIGVKSPRRSLAIAGIVLSVMAMIASLILLALGMAGQLTAQR
jgi:serine/threonine protein kinase